MRYTSLLVFPLTILFTWSCKPAFYEQITEAELKETISFLASDSLKGRYPGSPEDRVLAEYIAGKMDISGLMLFEDLGFQEFKIEQGFFSGANNTISVGGEVITRESSGTYKVLGFSSTDTVSGKFMQIETEMNMKLIQDKIVIVDLPSDLPESVYEVYSLLRTECLKYSDMGAKAVVYSYSGKLPDLNYQKRLTLPIPVLAAEDYRIDEFLGLVGEQEITIVSEILPKHIVSYNTIAELSGSDKTLSGEYVIIGAHHDHLGMGGVGSSSRKQDTIAVHYGADDNASGVASVIELAQNLMSQAPKRSFVFTTFGGEEMGLLGSKYYAANPSIDLSKVQAMINIDMLGRMTDKRQLQIGGVGTSPGLTALIDTINKKYNFSISYSEAGYGPSDHSSFYAKDIPVLFISTGAHPDYHTPFDTEDKINYAGMTEALNFISEIALELANNTERIAFTEAGPKESSGSRGRMGGVTFGLMPDVMYDGNEGMPVSFVTAGKPAAIGGMKGGDIIVSVDGKPVGNVHDYMQRLGELKEGQSVVVTVIREEEKIDLLLKL